MRMPGVVSRQRSIASTPRPHSLALFPLSPKPGAEAMTFDTANQSAGTHLMSGATLDELEAVASDLRALSQGSALADLVDEKIRQIRSQGGQDEPTEQVAAELPMEDRTATTAEPGSGYDPVSEPDA
jgi:hypothetical protein